ncbi:hypothetical protein EJD97_023221, partial [Solanum chilense]
IIFEQVEIKRTIREGSAESKDLRTKTVFVGGIAFVMDDDEFKGFFSKYGKVRDCEIIRTMCLSGLEALDLLSFMRNKLISRRQNQRTHHAQHLVLHMVMNLGDVHIMIFMMEDLAIPITTLAMVGVLSLLRIGLLEMGYPSRYGSYGNGYGTGGAGGSCGGGIMGSYGHGGGYGGYGGAVSGAGYEYGPSACYEIVPSVGYGGLGGLYGSGQAMVAAAATTPVAAIVDMYLQNFMPPARLNVGGNAEIIGKQSTS